MRKAVSAVMPVVQSGFISIPPLSDLLLQTFGWTPLLKIEQSQSGAVHLLFRGDGRMHVCPMVRGSGEIERESEMK